MPRSLSPPSGNQWKWPATLPKAGPAPNSLSGEVTAVASPRYRGEPAAVRTSSPDRLLELARNGSAPAREELVRRFTPFILKTAAQVAGRYLKLGQDDEASIGLMAFDEAIDSFDPRKGKGFLPFAETVIRRRIIDHFRQNKARRREIPLTAFEEEDEEGRISNTVEHSQAMAAYAAGVEALERKEEILRFRQLLAGFGISLDELVRMSPRHQDARERAIAVARVIASTPEHREHLLARGELPLKALTRQVDLSRKALERQRKYIIAVALILIEDLAHLKEYVRLATDRDAGRDAGDR